jgi:hypothetical protein
LINNSNDGGADFGACREVGDLPIFRSMLRLIWNVVVLCGVSAVLTQCGTSSLGSGNLGGPTIEERDARIAAEPTGNFYYGRRYLVEKTRFWGYLRQPRESWNRAKLVVMREEKKSTPDRMSESGAPGQSYGFDANAEYRIHGYYTGREVYEPNSNQFLSEFMLTDYEMVDRQPGWLFRPEDHYDRLRITMVPR